MRILQYPPPCFLHGNHLSVPDRALFHRSGKKQHLSVLLHRARPKPHLCAALFTLGDASSCIQGLVSKIPIQEFIIGRVGSDEGELQNSIATTITSPFFELFSKLRKEDIEAVIKNLSSENRSHIQEILKQTVDMVSQIGSSWPSLSEETVEKVKNFITYFVYPDDVQIHLNEAFTYMNGFLTSFKDQADDVLRMILPFSRNNIVSDDMLRISLPFTQNGILVATIIFAYILIIFGFTMGSDGSSTRLEGNELPVRYDPEAIEAYFQKRPKEIYSRLIQVVFELSSFAVDLIIDKVSGTVNENEKVRAKELVDLITKLGPTSIKIGQALSIRPDILPVAYIEELQTLQDRVPPFSNIEAKNLILEGLGKPVEELFTDFSSEPIAAASLGQVYKARLKESEKTVAIKVQRPGVLEGICRDLYLFRSGAKLLQTIPNVRSNLVALLDNWAFRFFDELDYEREGENALQFAKNMKSLPNIFVPDVYTQYTSRKVLTTQWVEGEKLSESNAGDLLQLVKVALNCYLMQLLESGFLHADPHPGNLLRTENGSLCVLDYGLMTQITLEQQYAFIDYISHLVNADYALVAEDLVKLGFVPPDLVDPAKTVSVVPQLSRVLGELVQGGGARKVNFQQITEDLSNMSKDYVFVLPPYFALILRAFSVLEGIGLAANPDYTILDDCYSYLCKRLITDDSPRTRAALKYFVYAGKDRLDVARAENIISGFRTFQSLTVLQSGKSNKVQQPSVDPAAKEVLTLMFAPNGSYLQDLLLTELVRIVDALSRDALAEVWQYFASRTLISLPPALLTPKSWPIPLPGLFLGSSRVATLSDEDQQSLEAVKRLWVLLEPQFMLQRPSRQEIRDTASDVIPLISQLFPGMINTGQRFVLMLLQRQALRFADDLDGKQSVSEWDRDPAAFARKIRPLISGS